MKVFLDMDGVIVDFVGGVLRLLPLLELDHSHINAWDMAGCLGITEESLWQLIDAGEERFWADLDWTEDGEEILTTIETLFGQENVCLLSSPSRNPHSASGKLRWIQRHLPAYARRYLLGPKKHFLAGPQSILIDDADHNIEAFRAAGGIAVLVPRPWNDERDFHGKPVHRVMARLHGLREEGKAAS